MPSHKRKKNQNLKSKREVVFPHVCNKEIVHLRPVITKDSKHVICGSQNNVLVYRLKTGILERCFTQHKTDVIAVFENVQDPLQVISCSSHEIIVWDFTDLSVNKVFHVPFQMNMTLMSTQRSLDKIFFTAVPTGEKKKKSRYALFEYNLLTNEHKNICPTDCSKKCCAISASGQTVACIRNVKLTVYCCKTGDQNSYTNDDSPLRLVAFHPTQNLIATGDNNGKIVLWYDVNVSSHVVPVRSKLHWHNNPMNDILFMKDGFYMVSGGRESVLVVWHLETQHKSFLPRLGGTIKHLCQSPDGLYLALSLESNTIKILSTQDSNLLKAIKGLSQPFEAVTAICYETTTNCLVLNGRPDGVLQFYDPKQDAVKLNLDVIGENLIPSLEERLVYPSKVKKVAFSFDSQWMATIELHKDEVMTAERKLKFWKYTGKHFMLNTMVAPVHSDTVTSLLFSPMQYVAITTSTDGHLKMWSLNSLNATSESWQISSVNSYYKQPCKMACFSQDASLLAVLFNEVTLWDAGTLSLEKILTWNFPTSTIQFLTFCHHSSEQYLVGYSNDVLVSWDISTLNVSWQMTCSTQLVVSDPTSKYFVAFIWFEKQMKLHLYLFDPSQPTPVGLLYSVAQCSQKAIQAAIFTPKESGDFKGSSIWSEIGHLYYLTKNMKVVKIAEKGEFDRLSKSSEVEDETSTFESLFNLHKPGNKTAPVSHQVPVGNSASEVIKKMCTVPSHALPRTNVLCKAFLESLILSKPIVPIASQDVSVATEKGEVVSGSTYPEKFGDRNHSDLGPYDFTFLHDTIFTTPTK